MIRLWLCLCGLLALVPALGQPVADAVAIGAQDHYVLSHDFTYFEDRQAHLTLDDILQPQVQAQFQAVPHSGHGANFGFTASAIWLRVQLQLDPASPPDWFLELAYPPLNRIDLYSSEGPAFRHESGGNLLPFATRAIPHRNHVLPVELMPGATTTLYLRLQSDGTVVAPVTLWQPAALWRHDQAGYGGLGLYFGLLIGLLLYNLLLLVSVRDVGYLIYVAFVAAMGVGQAALTGLGAQFLWPEWTWWNRVSPLVGMSAAAIFGLMFVRHFITSAQRMPRADRSMQLQMGAWCLSLVGALVLPYTLVTWLVTVLAIVSVITGMWVSVESIRRGITGARVFLSAWAALLAGALTLALHNAGVLPSNVVTVNSLLIGSALEMVLLSFALADRINVARRFKEMAQARIAAEHAMVVALTQSQDELREILREREAILNSMRVGIALAVRRRHEWVNQKFAQMAGRSAESLIGETAQVLFPDAETWERFGAKSRSALLETGSYLGEHQLRRSDGELFWVEISGTCLYDKNPDAGVIWTYLDISVARRPLAPLDEMPPTLSA